MATLEQCVRGRHSTRFFKSDPVPLDVLRECLSLAQLAPSNSNIQNWRMAFATGHARDRIVGSLQVRRSFPKSQGPLLTSSLSLCRRQKWRNTVPTYRHYQRTSRISGVTLAISCMERKDTTSHEKIVPAPRKQDCATLNSSELRVALSSAWMQSW